MSCLTGSNMCVALCSLAGRGDFLVSKANSRRISAFYQQESGPLCFWGDATKSQLSPVRAVTTLCLHRDIGFLGRKLGRSKYEINVYRSAYENKIVDSFSFRITWGKLSNRDTNCEERWQLFTPLHVAKTYMPLSTQPGSHRQRNSPSQWLPANIGYIKDMENPGSTAQPWMHLDSDQQCEDIIHGFTSMRVVWGIYKTTLFPIPYFLGDE